MRLQRYLAQAGVASRRRAEDLIASGVVKVNGRVVTTTGVVIAERDRVEVEGKRVLRVDPVYRVILKPRACLATLGAAPPRSGPPSDKADAEGDAGGKDSRANSAGKPGKPGRPGDLDKPGRPGKTGRSVGPAKPGKPVKKSRDAGGARDTIGRYLRNPEPGLQVVAPLDFPAEGVMLLTTDGELADAMTRRRQRVPMTYHLKMQGAVTDDELTRLARGWRWEGVPVRPLAVQSLATTGKNTWIEVTVPEARPRALKAAGELIRHSVLKISRVRLGGLSFEGLEMGGWRDLSRGEIADLRHRAGLQ